MKILIADDERTVHEQLSSMIPWSELGWEIVGHAYNGEEAKEMTEKQRPNLILTDIRMPLMDGLGFMAWLEASAIEAKVIVLSGYGEFDYSRSAFKLGAYDYLLKPIQESELLLALGKAVERIREDSRSRTDRLNEKAVLGEGLLLMQDELLTQIIGASITDENEMVVQAQRLLIELPEQGYAAAVVRFAEFEQQVQERYEGDRPSFYYAARNAIGEMAEGALVFRNLLRANEFVMLLPLEDRNAKECEPRLRRLQRALSSGLKMSTQIGASMGKQRVAKLGAAYAEAQHALETLRASGHGEVAFYELGSRSQVKTPTPLEREWKEIGALFDMLAEGGALRDTAGLLARIRGAFRREALADASASEWKKAVADFIQKLDEQPMSADMRAYLNEARASVQTLRFGQVEEALLKWIEAFIELQETAGKARSGKDLIDSIRRFIEEHYRMVSLEQISERFFLNKNYFCTLFKNATGQSFMEYVVGVRMEQAKRLLRESTLKTYEVADAVGYADQRYFSQVFRKHTGLQPTQYRQLSNSGENA